MNIIILVGNLTKDPELTQTNSGINMCRMSVAVNRRFTNAAGEREADFFNIIAWRELGERCQKYLKKGSKVGIRGSLQNRTYDAGDGNKKYFTDVVADDVEFLSPKNDSEGGGGYEPAEPKAAAPKKSIKDVPPIPDDELPF